MEGIKLYVRNKEESKLAQKKAFELGFGWIHPDFKKIIKTNYSFLFFTLADNLISLCQDEFNFFKEHPFKELSLNEWLEYEPGVDDFWNYIDCKPSPIIIKKKKWKKLSDSALIYAYSGIKIKDPDIINQSTTYSPNGIRKTLTIECDGNDIKVKQ